ncbi:secondary thiamine-phosphate synthase enzyme [Bacteroidia bacterium]|nr:secondary thiamine-phosphate synthase enzyme [Bacteroidia bacterium]
MKTIRETLKINSTEYSVTFHDITEQVQDIVMRSGIQNGISVVYSHHTTCSVMMQECSFDLTYTGKEYLQQDLLDIFESVIPTCRKEGQYMHPGPLLTEFAAQHDEGKPQTLNTDGHLRSVFLGRNETIVVADGEMDLGQFGHIYFIDFDHTCTKERTVQVQVMGE